MYVSLRFFGASTSQVIGAHNEWLWMIMMAKWYSGTLGSKASWHLSHRWGKTPKNLTQETCPDQESNPGPLRDRRACYHLSHSGERVIHYFFTFQWYSAIWCRHYVLKMFAYKMPDVGTPFSSIHGSTHYLQMTKPQLYKLKHNNWASNKKWQSTNTPIATGILTLERKSLRIYAPT